MIRKTLIVVGGLIGLLVVVVVGLIFGLRHPLPPATPGPAGDELAHRVAASVGAEAWDHLGAIRWTLGGKRHYLWDKAHGFVRVRFADNEVLLDLMKMDGRAFVGGNEQSGDAQKSLIDAAYKWFCNDSFWLNPLTKLFDDGTSRAAVEVDGKPALLVSYASGGVTPGDKYLWLLGDDGRPRAWRIWVSVIKFVPGVEFAWQGWTDVGGGALVATAHRALGFGLQPVTDLAGAPRPEDLEPGPNPFAALAAKR